MGLKFVDDETHLNYATAEGRTVLTSDEDFPALHQQWQQMGEPHKGILYVQHERKDNIGLVVRELLFLHEAIVENAATLEYDVYNQLRYI